MIGAIDIGGTKIAVGIVDRNGIVEMVETFPTDAKKGPELFIVRVVEWLRAYTQKMNISLEGVGIGCTGPVYPQSGTIGKLDFLPGWEGFNIVNALSSEMGVMTALENDADATALGEWAWGCGKDTNNFIMVTIGTGIGVGLVLDGKLYRGVDGAHPEIGHHFIDPSGPKCSCGGRGCWESLASGPAMVKWARNQQPKKLYRNAQEICSASILGDNLAERIVKREAFYLGLGLANLVTLFTPQVIALGGGVMASHELFMPTIMESVRLTCGYVPREKVKIIPVPLDNNAGVRGAAKVWLNRYQIT